MKKLVMLTQTMSSEPSHIAVNPERLASIQQHKDEADLCFVKFGGAGYSHIKGSAEEIANKLGYTIVDSI